MKILFSVLLFVIYILGLSGSNNANATVYYISNSGNDSNTGTNTSSPWQTISKVNTAMSSAVPGDQFLFHKGDTFYGTVTITKSGTAGNKIVIGSYGSGNLPVITGKKLITGWTLHSGNIYKAPVTDSIFHLYIGNKLMTIARYPNTGYLKIDANISNTGFNDAALTQSSGYWNGANVRLRTANWSYETKVVSNFNGGNITFNSATQYTTTANYGYYLDNKLILLDTQNEWYRDYAGGYIYLHAPGGVNPNSLSVEALVKRDGIFINISKHYIDIKDIKLNGFGDMGINAYTSNNVSVTNCTITQTTNNAVFINGSNAVINNNYFEDNINNAINGLMNVAEIKNNFINRTGLYPGYGTNGRGYLGLKVHFSTNLVIENNVIDSTGYSAMSVGKNALIKNNFINYSLLKLNDGAGIDIADSDSMKILNNVIFNTIGNTESSSNPSLYGSGIYINAGFVKNTLIENNTSAYNTYSGIYMDHKGSPVNNKIIGNILYNNYNMQILFADFTTTVNIPVYNTIVKNNVFYSLSSEQFCMVQRTYSSSSYNNYGTFDSNYYCNPYSEYSIAKVKFIPEFIENVYSLSIWQNTSGKDAHSAGSLFSFGQFGVTDTLSQNLITNSGFNTDSEPWVSWPVGCTINWTTNNLLDDGCSKITWNGNGYTHGFCISNTYPITRDEYYLVSLSTAGHSSGSFNIWGFSSYSSSFFTFPQKFFSFDNVRKDYSFTYKADTSDPAAKLSIGLILPDTAVFIDNVKKYRVNVEKIDSSMLSKFFYNETSAVKNISLNGITYKDIKGIPVTGSITLQPYTSRILINENYIPSRKLQLKVLIEGIYNGVQDKMKADSVRVYMRNAAAPYSIIDSTVSTLDSTGSGSFDFYNVINSTNYFITVKHRSSVETWSSSAVSFNGNLLNYDFTNASSKAYGNNQIQIGSKFCNYSGDVNNDDLIELSDALLTMEASGNFLTGYVTEDINGDALVDFSDINIVYNNANNFISTLRP